MIENRKVFILHERNRAAFENLHRKEHDSDHTDLEGRFRAVLGDASIPVEQRVRMACALGAVMGGLIMAGDTFGDVPSDEFGALLRGAVRDLLDTQPATAAAKRGAPSRAPRRPKNAPRVKS
jgi:hypothetical protein